MICLHIQQFHLGHVLIAAAVLTVLALLARRFLRPINSSSSTVAWPFYPKKLLTEPEQVLYHRLVRALPDHIVFAQVQLSRVLGVKKGSNFREWNNRISRMSLDFAVCRKDASIVAAIELDDATHDEPKRVEADAKKDKALASAGVRLVRWLRATFRQKKRSRKRSSDRR